jgi:hypothetical protein
LPGVADPALTVRVEPAPAVTDVGLSEAVGPAGETKADRLTVAAFPVVTAVEIALAPLPPKLMLRLVGDAPMLKSFATTVSATVVECVLEPSVPVMVRV